MSQNSGDVTAPKWITKISSQGPWDESSDPLPLSGAPALPMPVEIAHPTTLAPFFQHLSTGGTHEPAPNGVVGVEPYGDAELIEFEKGVLYADGRVDLCKMVTGPRNIGALMQALRSNTFAKHFLLGNNIIGPTGAEEISRFIVDFPHRFETWYLAGNCIDTASFHKLVDAMVKSPVITNIWLKRNPLQTAACTDIYRLITELPALRTLDLDQTELGDDGIASLFSRLNISSKPIALRHVYLNATGLGPKACAAISHYLANPTCRLESLYISNNPVGDNISLLAAGLRKTTTLQRLSLQSCGLKDPGCISLLESLTNHPSLKVLDLGQSYATQDLNSRFNWLTDASAPAIKHLINSTPLQYLNLSYQPLSQTALNPLLEAAIVPPTLLVFNAKPLVKGGKSYTEVKAGQLSHRLLKSLHTTLTSNVLKHFPACKSYKDFENGPKRFLLSPKDVRLIDSVYRNRDFEMARKGVKRFEKWWGEGDETLREVAEGVGV
ncbi:hypothetical protein M409DRAFT_66427 [Zasmidium cellare ATCC 36951]|uniref:RNI-like protein n=1 Tax=Zasmidium cellare ATCC 36951 TaxID=1080233 RepID=A0A6A6CLR4_ZASCE|nr:uncharacterized protein M409DRAFT_66427 [Zasmidium cellare ATCC 36951]KAF2166882.1 hypothetical protein M409DRAFT_66427 [Zasmidium cellare ATCC 36951]